MTLPATPHTIVISSGASLVSIPSSSKPVVEYTSDVNTLPKYAVGLFDSNGSGPRKRKRLTHLTPEEKIMRRKLKNRVAAQSARDRKRFKMETLEETVQKIQLQAQKLLDCNMQLLKRAEALEQENADLRSRLGIGTGTEVNTTVSGNRKVIEKIKVEFDETTFHNISNSPCSVVPDSILSPDESADENDSITGFKLHDNSIDSGDISESQITTECASPKPAAGSCQPPVDPLQSFSGDNSKSTVCGRSHADDDILNLLEQIGSNFDAENFLELSQLTSSSTGLDDKTSTLSTVSLEQLDSIKELITVDHLYSKPSEENPRVSNETKKPSFKIQLSRSIPSTKLIKQPTLPIKVELTQREDKPIALYEGPALVDSRTVQSKFTSQKLAQTCIDQERAQIVEQHPMLCDTKQEGDPFPLMDTTGVLDLDNLDAELDNILSDTVCDTSDAPLINPMEDIASAAASTPISFASECNSPLSSNSSYSIDTPSPVAHLIDPFETDTPSFGSYFDDSFSNELFPQLAVI